MTDHSFDIVSKFDHQELSNAVHQAMKEIQTRFDFKGSKSNIELGKDEMPYLETMILRFVRFLKSWKQKSSNGVYP